MAFNDKGNQLEFAAQALTLTLSQWERELHYDRPNLLGEVGMSIQAAQFAFTFIVKLVQARIHHSPYKIGELLGQL
jgi:hypothetical protein